MVEINIREIVEALNGKSDIDLNNLNNLGAKKFYGGVLAWQQHIIMLKLHYG